MSPIAYSLYQYLRSRPPGVNVVMEEICRQVRGSKTAVRSAFRELEAEGLLSVTQEV